ncbi:MAG: anti-sigma factor, partial [Atribacterota bacterium]|nr:anti-sigma factor [Atribacterota bacterium]
MKCLQARELFQEYLDKHISAEKRSQLEEHLLNCPSCQKELKEWEILFSDIQILTEEKTVPAGLTQSIMSHIQTEKITAKQS